MVSRLEESRMDLTWIDRALGSNIPYITYAVPVFFLLIGVELVVALWEQKKAYRLHDSINDLSAAASPSRWWASFSRGCCSRVTWGHLVTRRGRGINLVDVQSYSAGGKWAGGDRAVPGRGSVRTTGSTGSRMSTTRPGRGTWCTIRARITTSRWRLRQGTFQGVFSWVFYLPLALLGFPPAWFAAMSSFDTLYQFWIHTRLIGKLGPLEWVLNTPSHHRVHHGRNPKYLDKNYAGTLIIWDRMFGTFQAEEEEPVYGLTKPLNSWNPLWANLHVWRDLCRDAWLAPRWIDKLRIWFMPQGWRPAGLPPNPVAPEVTRQTVVRVRHAGAAGIECLCVREFRGGLAPGGRTAGGGQVAWPAASWPRSRVLVLWALLNIGGIFDHRRWALPSELLRLPVTAAALGRALTGAADGDRRSVGSGGRGRDLDDLAALVSQPA